MMAGYESRTGGLLASTWIGYSLLFWFYPLAWLVVLSVTRWQFIGAPQFTGLQNIIGVLHDALFWTSMWNICRFLMWYVPIVFITALLFAAGLRRINYGRGVIALSFYWQISRQGWRTQLSFPVSLMSTARLTAYCLRGLGFPCRGLPTLTAPCYPLRLS